MIRIDLLFSSLAVIATGFVDHTIPKRPQDAGFSLNRHLEITWVYIDERIRNVMNIALVITGIALLTIFIWMGMLSSERKKMAAKKLEQRQAYRKALARQKDCDRKERIFKADTGHIPAQLYLAKEAELSNPREALYWYEKAALLDSEIAMYGLVRVCGRAPKDEVLKEKARFWQLCIQAKEGSRQAKFEMGKAFLSGAGIDVDVARGIQAMKELAEEDYVDAQVFIGDWYVAESNPEPNPKLAAEWHFRAAQMSNQEGQIKLGHHYRDGVGVRINRIRASYWYERAGEQGNNEAQYYAGEIWAGQGANGNLVAYIWFFLSAHLGYEAAKTRRDEVGNLIGVDIIIGLQDMVKPIVKKLQEGPLAMHSFIKILNKLYKRESYFPDIDGNEFMTLGHPSDAEKDVVGAQLENDATSQPSLDFSQSLMNKNHS